MAQLRSRSQDGEVFRLRTACPCANTAEHRGTFCEDFYLNEAQVGPDCIGIHVIIGVVLTLILSKSAVGPQLVRNRVLCGRSERVMGFP